MELEEGGAKFVSPNLTPDPETGRTTTWSEDTFVAGFRTRGNGRPTPMPWRSYSRVSDDDLRAIYRYLRTLTPVRNATPPGGRPISAG